MRAMKWHMHPEGKMDVDRARQKRKHAERESHQEANQVKIGPGHKTPRNCTVVTGDRHAARNSKRNHTARLTAKDCCRVPRVEDERCLASHWAAALRSGGQPGPESAEFLRAAAMPRENPRAWRWFQTHHAVRDPKRTVRLPRAARNRSWRRRPAVLQTAARVYNLPDRSLESRGRCERNAPATPWWCA